MVPENILIDTVARLQQDLADIRAESRHTRSSGVPPVVLTPRQAAFTTTKVPRFGERPVGNSIGRCLTPYYFPMGGMTRWRRCSYSLTWREML